MVVVAGAAIALVLLVRLNDAVDRAAQPGVEPPASILGFPEAALEEAEFSSFRGTPAETLRSDIARKPTL